MEKNASNCNKTFIRNYDEDSGRGYIFEVDVKYPKRLHNFHSDLLFLQRRMKINKCNKHVCNLYDKKLNCSHNSFKTSIKSWSSIKLSSWSS